MKIVCETFRNGDLVESIIIDSSHAVSSMINWVRKWGSDLYHKNISCIHIQVVRED